MSELADAAREEVLRRYPIWRDADQIGGSARHGPSYRAGFIAGATWAEERVRALLSVAKIEMAAVRAAREAQQANTLDARAQLVEMQRALAAQRTIAFAPTPPVAPLDDGMRERLVARIVDILDSASIEFSSEGQALVGDQRSLALQILERLVAPGDAEFEAARTLNRAITEHDF